APRGRAADQGPFSRAEARPRRSWASWALLGAALLGAFASQGCSAAVPTGTLTPRKCLCFYEDGNGCALNARIPETWRELEASFGLRNNLRSLHFELPGVGGASSSTVDITYVPVGPPPPKLRGASGSARPEILQAQLRDWEAEFPPERRTSLPRRSGEFDAAAGTAVSLSVSGTWVGPEESPRAPQPDSAMLAAVIPARPAGEGERQFAFLVRTVGPAGAVAANADAFASFVRSAQTDSTYLF
ncbi:unnamed protein product, partial [Polarella glacialis]